MYRVYSSLLAVLLSMSGAVALLGPALHMLPGLGHAASQSAPTAQVDSAADDCPVCQFLAQSHFPPEFAIGVWTVQSQLHSDAVALDIELAAPYQPGNSRAPPFGAVYNC